MSRHSPTSPIARRLREARERKGISQRALTKSAGFDDTGASPRLSQWETGRHAPAYHLLVTLAAHLDVPPSYFYVDDDDLAELVRMFATASPTARKRALEVLGEDADKPSSPSRS